MIACIGEVVALVRRRHPHSGFGAVVEHDLLGQHETEIVLEELAVGLDVDSQTIEVIDAPYVDAASRKSLCLILERRLLIARRLVPFGVVIDFKSMAIRILEDESLAVAEIAVRPPDVEAGALQRGGAAFEGLRRAGPEGGMAEAGRL